MTVMTANVDPDLIDWADDYHALLGYRSRSAMINDLLAEKRENTDVDEVTQ